MNSLNVDDNFYVYASMSGDGTLLQKLSHISNNCNLRLCRKPHFFQFTFFFSSCVQNIAVLFNNYSII